MSVRAVAFAIALLLPVLGTCVPRVSHAATTAAVAPADEYFGRLKMSILGIRNRIHDIQQRLAQAAFDRGAVAGQLALVEDAMRDWEARYPADPWSPRFQAQLGDIHAARGL